MIGTALAIGLAAASAAGSIGSAAIGSSAAGKAADAQTNAANYAADLQAQTADKNLGFQRDTFNAQQQNLAPWIQTGGGAVNRLGELMGITPTAAPQMLQGSALEPNYSPEQQAQLSPIDSEIKLRENILKGYGGGTFQPGEAPHNPGTVAKIQGEIQALNDQRDQLTKTFQPVSQGSTSGGLQPQQATSTAADFGALTKGFTEQFQAPGASGMEMDPGYQFRLAEGQKALERSAAAKGGLLTGATAKAITRYGQDFASNEYSNAYNRSLGEYQQRYNIYNNDQTNQFNRLSALSGGGQTAATQLNGNASQTAANVGNILQGSANNQADAITGAANARASGYLSSAQAWGNGINGAINNGFGVYGALTNKF